MWATQITIAIGMFAFSDLDQHLPRLSLPLRKGRACGHRKMAGTTRLCLISNIRSDILEKPPPFFHNCVGSRECS